MQAVEDLLEAIKYIFKELSMMTYVEPGRDRVRTLGHVEIARRIDTSKDTVEKVERLTYEGIASGQQQICHWPILNAIVDVMFEKEYELLRNGVRATELIRNPPEFKIGLYNTYQAALREAPRTSRRTSVELPAIRLTKPEKAVS